MKKNPDLKGFFLFFLRVFPWLSAVGFVLKKT